MSDIDEKIKLLFEDGFSIFKCADILNIDVNIIVDFYNQNRKSFKINKEIFTEKRFKELYLNGAEESGLAIKFAKSIKEIKQLAEELQIQRGTKQRIYDCNEHIFDNIDNPDKAYWLGFLYADAYHREISYRISLTLWQVDLDHIKKYAKFLGVPEEDIVYSEKTAEEMYKNRKRPKNYDENRIYKYCGVHLHSKILSDSLNRHGCFQAKSHKLTYPYWLREDLHVHFIRGVFDGDGCITNSIHSIDKTIEWKWSIMGTKEICEGINFYIEKYTGKTLSIGNSNDKLLSQLINNYNGDLSLEQEIIKIKNKNTYLISTNGNEKIAAIGDWLWSSVPKYKDITLERKYDKYLILKSQQSVKIKKRGGRLTHFLQK